MGTYITHYSWDADADIWGILEVDQIHPLHNDFASLKELLVAGRGEIQKLSENHPEQGLPLDSVDLISPIAGASRLICVGNNFLETDPETGKQSKPPKEIMFYRKDESSLQGAKEMIPRPAQSRLLDYGVEVGLIIGKSIHSPITIDEAELEKYVAGIVMLNDLHPRDHSLRAPGHQWFQGNSYRGMSPAGPFIYLFDEGEAEHLHNLDLKLWVDDDLRQNANTKDWALKPADVISRISQVINLDVGDIILMGTPDGSAARPVSSTAKKIGGLFLSENTQAKLIIDKAASNPHYLKTGQIVKCTIASPNGKIDLGTQICTVE